jgi:hypothetical protein
MCRQAGAGLLLLILTNLLTTTAVATETGAIAPAPYPEARLKLLDNKIRLFDTLLHRNEAIRRIEQSQSQQVRDLLATARAAFDQAQALRASGGIEECEREVSRGLEAFSSASRLVGDPQYQAQIARNRYRDLQQLVAGFNKAFTRIVAERIEEARLLDLSRVDRLMQRAEAHAQRDDYEAAIALAHEARGLLELALSSSRHQQTLVHELKFASPAEEYAYETQHNQGHEALIRLLLVERTYQDEVRSTALSILDENARWRSEAEALVARGQTPKAIRRLEDANARLTQALRQLGVPIQ